MIKQLRPFYTPEERAAVYDHQYNHTNWADHIERVQYTAQALHDMEPTSVADLSCGDGAIVQAAFLGDIPITLGDLVPNPAYQYFGPIEETVDHIEYVDVFLLSETLEHVEDPLWLLKKIRERAQRLLLTTPDSEWDSGNPEHYWGWDQDGIADLLAEAGWENTVSHLWTPQSVQHYTFQIWEAM